MTESYLENYQWCPICDHEFYNQKGIEEELNDHFNNHHNTKEIEQALAKLITSLIRYSRSKTDVDEILMKGIMDRAKSIMVGQIMAENKIVS